MDASPRGKKGLRFFLATNMKAGTEEWVGEKKKKKQCSETLGTGKEKRKVKSGWDEQN